MFEYREITLVCQITQTVYEISKSDQSLQIFDGRMWVGWSIYNSSVSPDYRLVYVFVTITVPKLCNCLSNLRFSPLRHKCSWLSCKGPLVLLLTTLNYLAFYSLDFKRTWWMLYQKRIAMATSFSGGRSQSTRIETGRHDIAEILLKVVTSHLNRLNIKKTTT